MTFSDDGQVFEVLLIILSPSEVMVGQEKVYIPPSDGHLMKSALMLLLLCCFQIQTLYLPDKGMPDAQVIPVAASCSELVPCVFSGTEMRSETTKTNNNHLAGGDGVKR